eukprot:TRINITY_DN21131_c0_g1_i1.p1 TRINITY_DN21131_c0_g1~~TRINITY_DN21131_c0_g1_i1.p1  ORF type:complete len:544 (+),score=128.12 TRINITY_DN21131_c0_g1_i1:85-1632(+)
MVDTTEILANFIEITGSDGGIASQLLEATAWKIESAVQLFFAGGAEGFQPPKNQSPEYYKETPNDLGGLNAPPQMPNKKSVPTSAAGLLGGLEALEGDDYVRPPLPVKREALYDAASLYRSARPSNRPPPVDAFRNFQQEEAERKARLPATGEATKYGGEEGEPEAAAAPKDKLATLFRPPFRLMFQGTLEQAKQEGTRQNKWLLVNVQSHSEFASHTMNRDVWAHEAVGDLVSSYFIFWQIYDDTEEGQRACTYYRLLRQPSTLLLDPQTGQKMRSWEGMLGAEKFLEDVLPFLDEGPLDRNRSAPSHYKRARGSSPGVGAAMPQGRSQDPVDDEEEQLRQALAASMEDSRTGSAQQSEAKQQQSKMSPLQHPTSRSLEGQLEGAMPSDAKGSGSNQVPGEAMPGDNTREEAGMPEWEPAEAPPPLPSEPAGGLGTCRIAVRLPTGERKQRRFLLSDPLQYVRSFCWQSVPEASSGRPFRLSQMTPGSVPLDLTSSASVGELGLANTVLGMTWL